jgi:2-desacetyl-2-hydroxyethyl bacteriochlorophyllide A dehydrogenase
LEPGRLSLQEVEGLPVPDSGEALVRVHRVGICGTDLHAYRGRQPFFSYPRVLGHELGVEVIEMGGKRPDLRVGDRCSVEPYLNCGQCVACRRGKTNCCVQMRVLGVHLDGGMQEYLRIPLTKLHPSARLGYDDLALVETLGIGAHAVLRAQLQPDDTVLVIGAGPIGLATVQFVKLAGLNPVVMDTDANRLQFCGQTFQLDHCILADEQPLEAIRQAFYPELPTVVFDATGNAASMMKSFAYAAHGGKLVFVGLFQGEVTFSDPEFHKRELTLLASRNATGADFQRIILLTEAGHIQTAPWITHRSSLQTMPDEFASWLKPENRVVKAIVDVS